jgi:hypothetical protein
MPDLTQEQLSVLAQTGALNRHITATLGRPMSEEERGIVDRARLVWLMRRKAKRDIGPRTKAEQKRLERQRGREIERRQCENPKRRRRLERDSVAWLRHYMSEVFTHPLAGYHVEIIEAVEYAWESGHGAFVAAERGGAKTTILRGMAMKLVAMGAVRFPVLVGWKLSDTRGALRAWLRMLADSAAFRADYPELTRPFEEARHALAFRALTWKGTGQPCGASIDNAERMLVLPDSRGAIAARSARGDAKGLNVTLPDGTVLRPDMLLIDDAQDQKRADNPTAVGETVDVLRNVFMAMAGPRRRLITVGAGTIEHADDVTCRMLETPGWRTVRCSRIRHWPGGGSGGEWKPGAEDPQRRAWDDWWRVMCDEGPRAAKRVFRLQRARLTAGMEVSWRHRYDARVSVCALDAAMLDYYTLGPSVFSRAHQNDPMKPGVMIYGLTPAVICSRATERTAGAVPEWSRLRVAATDINPSYGLTWALVAFGADQTAAVIGYGVHAMTVPDGATEAEQARAIYEALVTHGRALAGLPCRPETWIVDAGGAQFDVVLRFAVESARLGCVQAVPATGRGAQHYKPFGKTVVGKPREGCHTASDIRGRKWLAFNTHYWHEVAQRAWTGSVGAPGSCSLPAGEHREFAEQICRDELIGKADLGAGMRWEWHKQPGPNDYGDCMAMAYMGAAWNNIGTGGETRQRRYVETRKCRVQREA